MNFFEFNLRLRLTNHPPLGFGLRNPARLRSGGFFYSIRPDAMNRVVFIVDGFNLYHSLKRAHPAQEKAKTRWLDLYRLCSSKLHLIGRVKWNLSLSSPAISRNYLSSASPHSSCLLSNNSVHGWTKVFLNQKSPDAADEQQRPFGWKRYGCSSSCLVSQRKENGKPVKH